MDSGVNAQYIKKTVVKGLNSLDRYKEEYKKNIYRIWQGMSIPQPSQQQKSVSTDMREIAAYDSKFKADQN